MKNYYLALPGPTPVAPEVLQQMSVPMFNHRGQQFAQVFSKLTENCRVLFQTNNPIYILTASGTGAMEAAVVNTLSPGDDVLSLQNGAFGQRFGDIARCYGANVTTLEGEWGQGLPLEQVQAALKAKTYKAILVIHCETSTGVLNKVQEVAKLRDQFSPETLILVDGISSLGATQLPVDQWNLDVVITGSQKVLAAPPGLAMISMSKKALIAMETAKMPRYYWDLRKYQEFMTKGQTPFTPAISQIVAMKEASQRFVDEGIEKAIQRHNKLMRMTRAGVQALGLGLVCSDQDAAPTVTSIYSPQGIKVAELREHLRVNQGLITAEGQGKYVGTVFRIGHLGITDEGAILSYLGLLEQGLKELELSKMPLGSAVAAALAI